MSEPAKKVRAWDIVNGKFFEGNVKTMQPNYVITPFGQKVSCVNLVATVSDKFVSDDSRYSTLTLDDGSECIRAKAFGEDIKIFETIEPGDLVLVIGWPKEYANEIYITANVVKKVESNYEILRKLEILDILTEQNKIVKHIKQFASRTTREELENHAKELGISSEVLGVIFEKKEVDCSPKILEVMEELDEGEGVEIAKIFEACELPDYEIERAINSLLTSGRIFEPSAGRFKKI